MKTKSFSLTLKRARHDKEIRMREIPSFFFAQEIGEYSPLASLSGRKMRS